MICGSTFYLVIFSHACTMALPIACEHICSLLPVPYFHNYYVRVQFDQFPGHFLDCPSQMEKINDCWCHKDAILEFPLPMSVFFFFVLLLFSPTEKTALQEPEMHPFSFKFFPLLHDNSMKNIYTVVY